MAYNELDENRTNAGWIVEPCQRPAAATPLLEVIGIANKNRAFGSLLILEVLSDLFSGCLINPNTRVIYVTF